MRMQLQIFSAALSSHTIVGNIVSTGASHMRSHSTIASKRNDKSQLSKYVHVRNKDTEALIYMICDPAQPGTTVT